MNDKPNQLRYRCSWDQRSRYLGVLGTLEVSDRVNKFWWVVRVAVGKIWNEDLAKEGSYRVEEGSNCHYIRGPVSPGSSEFSEMEKTSFKIQWFGAARKVAIEVR